MFGSGYPVRALFRRDYFRDKVRPGFRNVKRTDLEIVRNLDFDRDIIFRNASVMDNHFHRSQRSTFRLIDDRVPVDSIGRR